MLDDLKYIHQKDAQDALGVAAKQWQQLTYDYQLSDINYKGIENIVFAGMGGSALAGMLSNTWPDYSVPFELCRQYHIPAYVSEKTLFIASSYSGNTEETISALGEAENRRAQIVVITSGGKLQELAQQKGYPILLVPNAGQPRYAVFYCLKALVTILEKTGLVSTVNTENELQKASQFLQKSVETWLPTVPAAQNPAKQLAQELMGRSIAIYAGPLLSPAAYKWKISFNENAKNLAWWNEYPEFDHNELSGWSGQPNDKPYSIVQLRSKLENERVLKRFDVSDRILSGKRPAPNIVWAQGDNLLEQLLWTVVFGDFTSIYLALLNGVNPSPVELVEKLKAALNE